MPSWLAVLSTLTGVIIGALLRPLLDNYFELRKKTLRVDLSAGKSESILPDDAMKIIWGSRTFSRLVQRPFTIENRSGRTLRDFELRIDLLDQSSLPDGEELLFEVVMSEHQSARFENVTNTNSTRPANTFSFSYAEPKSMVHGFAVANCDGVLKFTSPSDLEISTVRKPQNAAVAMHVQRIFFLLTLALAAATWLTTSPDVFDALARLLSWIHF
jgi:hypothetical protein